MVDLLELDFENCRGISRLSRKFHLGGGNFAIYAPNGMMKTCFTKILRDYSQGRESPDQVFDRDTYRRRIVDREGNDVDPTFIVAVMSQDDGEGQHGSASTLLVSSDLRDKHTKLTKSLMGEKDEFIKKIRAATGLRMDFEEELSLAFTPRPDDVFLALRTAELNLDELPDDPFGEIDYRKFFTTEVIDVLSRDDVKSAIGKYILRYNQLLDESPFFHRDNFNHYNADDIAKQLDRNGFFAASHHVVLNPSGDQTNTEPRSLTGKEQIIEFVEAEKQRIADDDKLRATLLAVDKALFGGKQSIRAVSEWIQANIWVIPYLQNLAQLRQFYWQAHLQDLRNDVSSLLKTYESVKAGVLEISEEAENQQTAWDEVISTFNRRFEVPFLLTVKNRRDAVLGTEEPNLEFVPNEPGRKTAIDEKTMLAVLSSGEKRALHLLNVLFEIRERVNSGERTIFVFDDVADSFDYRNKYAIIEYLMEISEIPHFSLILLTHNFDFLRTIQSRGLVPKDNCLMAQRSDEGISLAPSPSLRNPFSGTWRDSFSTTSRNRIASIPFIRNLIEYTRGTDNPDYRTLTSLLHWKPDTPNIVNTDLDAIFKGVFGQEAQSPEPDKAVVDTVFKAAAEYHAEQDEIDLAGKVVIAMAARMQAERYMLSQINDVAFWEGISSAQMPQLVRRFRELGSASPEAIQAIDRVSLLTPEHIHLNAFMYEPLIDVSSRQLRQMYSEVLALEGEGEG